MTDPFSLAELEAERFQGWAPLAGLDASQVPGAPGVYVVYRLASTVPDFLVTSAAGRFKDRDPSADEAILRAKWVTAAGTVYIGKASKLRDRLRQYQQFGAGRPVGHWGGRYVWQLADHRALLVAWRLSTSPETHEAGLLRRFLSVYGRLPFANIAMPSERVRPVGRSVGPLPTTPCGPIVAAAVARQFAIAGRSVSLAPADVEAAMKDVDAEVVQKHGVRIAGRLYPVVQVLERATSIPRGETRSARARAVLGELGFPLVAVA